jgi:hypothetical protein
LAPPADAGCFGVLPAATAASFVLPDPVFVAAFPARFDAVVVVADVAGFVADFDEPFALFVAFPATLGRAPCDAFFDTAAGLFPDASGGFHTST